MAKRAVVGWILLGLAAAILFADLFQSPVGNRAASRSAGARRLARGRYGPRLGERERRVDF